MRMLVLLVAICAPAVVAAKAPFTAVHGGYLALSVADLDASAKWYAETFDLAVVKNHSQSPDKKATATILSGNGLIIELVQHADAMPLNQDQSPAPTPAV
jgi:hypothetical protein